MFIKFIYEKIFSFFCHHTVKCLSTKWILYDDDKYYSIADPASDAL